MYKHKNYNPIGGTPFGKISNPEMSKKVTIHNNEFEKFKETKDKNPKWMKKETKPFYHTFSQNTHTRSKNRYLVEKKLELADLTIEKFEDRYNHTTDIVHIFDISGQTLWINKVLKDAFFEDLEEVYLLPLLQIWINNNKDSSMVQNEMKYLMEECPKTFEFTNIAKTKANEEFFFKCFFERIDTKKGSIFGYISTLKLFPKHDGEKFLSQKKKSKKEKAQELFQEIMKCGAILDDEFKDLEQSNDQVIIIDMLGRMIWMNETFQDVNLKDLEVDIYESLLNDFGFEAYLELFEEVTKNNLDELKSNDIEFKKLKNNKGVAYGHLVTFKSLIQTPKKSSRTEIAEKLLSRVGLSFEIFKQKYGKNEKPIYIISVGGRLIYYNEAMAQLSPNTPPLIMNPVAYYVFKNNPENTGLKEISKNFFGKKVPEFSMMVEAKYPEGVIIKAKYDGKRLDSELGTPLAYLCEISILM